MNLLIIISCTLFITYIACHKQAPKGQLLNWMGTMILAMAIFSCIAFAVFKFAIL